MYEAEALFGNMVMGVVVVRRGTLALDAELHSGLEALLLENGSNQSDLWGINLYPDQTGEDFLEFDSLINVRPSQGNRSREVEDESLRLKIRNIIEAKVRL